MKSENRFLLTDAKKTIWGNEKKKNVNFHWRPTTQKMANNFPAIDIFSYFNLKLKQIFHLKKKSGKLSFFRFIKKCFSEGVSYEKFWLVEILTGDLDCTALKVGITINMQGIYEGKLVLCEIGPPKRFKWG